LLGGELQWRLISHLALNYMSIFQGGEDALKEILKLYDFDNSPSTRQHIEGVAGLSTEHVTKRIGQSFGRGVQVTLELDEDKFVGAGLYLFASVLERFLGQYVSVNSFSQLRLKTLKRSEILKTWPPRSGNRVLL
jgi:type VI secretion system protein ImpG